MYYQKTLSAFLSRLAKPLLLALALLLIAGLTLLWNPPEARAQDPIEVVKSLGRSSSVVRVGEVLTFTVVITNNSTFTLTTVPMTDTYRADILGYVSTTPYEPDEQTTSGTTGLLTWYNIADPAMFGPIPPGGVVSFIMSFTAEHPDTAVVNAARVHDALDESGSHSFEGDDQDWNDAVGGASPVDKRIEPPDFSPVAGMPLTFTVVITNDGAAVMTSLPLLDTYDPGVLTFSYAVPPPDLVLAASGVISWADLTTYFGDIPADTTVSLTVVFTALPGIDLTSTTNRAEVQGALDQYSNVLAPGADQVPITIIGETTEEEDEEEEEEAASTSTPQPTSTSAPSTPVPTATGSLSTPTAAAPAMLPVTGRSGRQEGLLMLMAGAVLILAASTYKMLSQRRKQ